MMTRRVVFKVGLLVSFLTFLLFLGFVRTNAFIGPGATPPDDTNSLLKASSTRALEIATNTVFSTKSYLLFQTIGGSNKHIIFSPNGNVGIGTTTPNYKLDVNGNVRTTGDFTVTGAISANTITASTSFAGPVNAGYLSAGVFGSNSTKGNYTFQASATTTPILFIDATSNRIGIGTTTPSYGLDVVGNFNISATSSFSGRVGIGTTTPNNLLQVIDLISFPSSTYNTFIGYQAGKGNTTGNSNTFIGYQAGYSGNGDRNGKVAVGYRAMYSGGGQDSIAIGRYALYNTAAQADTGVYNTAIGAWSLYNNIIGSDNIAIGFTSLYSITESDYNIGIGRFTLSSSTGEGNIAIGYLAGKNLTNGSDNILLGNLTDTPASDSSDFINIGNTIYGDMIGGNMSLGTTTFGYKLRVQGTSYFSQPVIVGTPTAASHAATKSYADSILTGGTATGTLATLVVTGTTTLATIAGNVGIGTTTPFYPLDVNGIIGATGLAIGTSPARNTPVGELQLSASSTFTAGYIDTPSLIAGTYQNYALQTEVFNNAAWVKTNIGTVTANTNLSPLNALTAEFIPAGTNDTASLSQGTTTPVAANQWFTFSVYLKTTSTPFTAFLRLDSSAQTGTAKSVNLDSSWRRYAVSQQFTGAATNVTSSIISGQNSFIAWGAQLEPYPFARPYSGAQTTTAQITTVTQARISGALVIGGALTGVTSLTMGGALSGVTNLTIGGTLTGATTGAFSGAVTITRANIVATSTTGLVLTNTAAASAASSTQKSPSLTFNGAGWTGSASTSSVWRIENIPITGNPITSRLAFSHNLGNTGFNEFFAFTNTGSLGIGTTTPAYLLDVAGTVHLRSTTTPSVVGLVVASNGKIGIASSSPGYALTVAGTSYFSQPVIVGTPTDDSHAATKNYVDSAIKWSVSGNDIFNTNIGNVIIGSLAGSGMTVDVNGGVKLNTVYAQPTCKESNRGLLWFTQGEALIKDKLEVCAKDDTDTYFWRSLW